MKTETPRKLVGVDHAADLLGLKRATIYGLVRRGVVPAVRLGRSVKFDPAQLERFIQAGGRALGQ